MKVCRTMDSFFNLSVGLAVLLVAADAPPVTAQSTVSEIASYLRSFRNNLAIEARGNQSQSDAEGLVTAEVSVLARRLDGRGLFSLRTETYRRNRKAPVSMQNDFVVYDSGSVLGAQRRLTDALEQSGPGALKLWSKEIAGVQTVSGENVIVKLGESAIVLWWLGRTPLELYLVDESSSSKWDSGRLLAKSRFGVIELEVFEGQHIPAWIRVTKTLGHDCLVGSLANWYSPFQAEATSSSMVEVIPDGAPPEPATPKVVEIVWECAMKDLQFAERQIFPRTFDVVSTTRFANGGESRFETHLTVESLELSPSLSVADLSSQLNFPVGTSVVVASAPHLPYRWDGEKAVPGVASISPVSEESTPVSPRGRLLLLLLLNGLLLILASIAYLAYRRRRDI
jgi:hypothetical protein